MNRLIQLILIITAGLVFGLLSFWATLPDEARKIDALKDNALCVLELPAGKSRVSTSFTTSRTVDRFLVGVRPAEKGEQVWLSISGEETPCSFKGSVARAKRFSLGREVPPWTFEVVLRQEEGDGGGVVVIADKEPPAGVTGWQIWSRTFVVLLVLSGIWAFAVRKSENMKRRVTGAYVFQMLLLAFISLFLYLLFHEGGHALAEAAFGRFDFWRSDFWGIHGHPHSAGTPGPALEPWQQALISGGGPMLPTFAGWAFFLFWISPFGKRLRGKRSLANLYIGAVIAVLILPSVVVTGCLLGIIDDTETQLFIADIYHRAWLVHVVLWGILAVNAFVLWRVVPEVWRAWRQRVAELRNPAA